MKKLFILFTAIAMALAFTLPATAATWDFYGSSRMATFCTSQSEEAGDMDNTQWDLQGNARIGANVKNGAISGRFEYGSGPNLRLLYGDWDFGGGVLRVGQSYTPVDSFYSNQVFGSDEGLLSWGGIYTGRQPLIQLSMGGLKIAAVKNHGAKELVADTGFETLLPKLEIGYGMAAGPVKLKFVGGASTYTTDPNGIDEDVTSYLAGFGAQFGGGPVTISVDGFYGQNVGTFGQYHQGSDDPVVSGDSIEDTNSYGGIFVANFKASPTLAFEVGAGYTVNENDTFAEDDDAMAYYGQAVITLAPGFFIVPEAGLLDNADGADGSDQGDTFYFGAKWQINF